MTGSWEGRATEAVCSWENTAEAASVQVQVRVYSPVTSAPFRRTDTPGAVRMTLWPRPPKRLAWVWVRKRESSLSAPTWLLLTVRA